MAGDNKVIPNFNLRLVGSIVGGLLIISLLIWSGSKLLLNLPAVTSEVTHTFQSNVTFTSIASQPSKTDTPSPTRTSIPLTQTTIPPTSQLGIGSTMISEKDGMTLLYVPAGEFTMGSDNGERDEKPVHTVDLDAFWIDQTEVTTAMYLDCVNDGECEEPARTKYYSDSNHASHPVVYVYWHDAFNYCSWADRRLPTEAEWEKAASWNDSTKEKFVYPWGNDFNCSKGNFSNRSYPNCNNFPITSPVGSFSTSTSPYGAFDMVGNVWEWVADWYSETYYASPSIPNPLGPDSGTYRVMRGGAYYSSLITPNYRSANRAGNFPSYADPLIGFRCAMSATP